MRITLHAVAKDDYPAFQHAMVSSLRAARLHDDRFKQTGLSIEEADGVVPDVLEHLAEPRTNAEMEVWLEARFGAPVPRLWWALRHYAPVVHAPTGGAWAHRERSAYIAAPVAPPGGNPAPSQRQLVRRYLKGFGPASAADIAQFTMLRRRRWRSVVAPAGVHRAGWSAFNHASDVTTARRRRLGPRRAGRGQRPSASRTSAMS